MKPILTTQSLPLIIAGLVMIIAGSSFVLSYVNLRRTAIDAGIPEDLAFLWPLCLDAFLVLASIYILRASIRNERTWPGWSVLITFTVISVLFNIQDSKTIISAASHAIPPLALCISLELFMEMLKTCSEIYPICSPVINERSEPDQVINDPDRGEQILEYLRSHPDQSGRQAAKILRCAPGTVSKYREKLKMEFPSISSGGEE